MAKIKANSFVRVIITLTTMLAVIALLIRNWLYIFWKDFHSSKELQAKFMELEIREASDHTAGEGFDPRQRLRQLSLIQRRQKFIESHKVSNFSKWLKKLCTVEFFCEVVILVIHPLPYVEEVYTFKILDMLGSKANLHDVQYLLSDFLFAFMFLRFYFVLRTITNFSIYSDLGSQRICKNNGFESNTALCLKASIRKNPTSTIVFTALFSVMWLSYLLRIFEKVYF